MASNYGGLQLSNRAVRRRGQIQSAGHPSMGVQAHSSNKPTGLRIVLLGKTGVGKSSTGNTILGKKIFSHKKSLNSVTKYCSLESSVVKGRNVSVIDTPGFFDTTLPEEKMAVEMAKSVFLSAPGPHAFLFVLPVDRFTKQEEEVLAQIQMIFGEDVLKYLIILFTNGDDIDLETFDTEVNEHNILRPILERCQGRFHVFNNKDENNREQVNDLLLKIDTMIEQNGGGHYSNQMYKDAQRFRQEEEERRQREKDIRNGEEADDREERFNESERLISPDRENTYSDRASRSAFFSFFQCFGNIFRSYASNICGCCRSVSDSE